MVGYIWKLEYGIKKGYHYHFIFFMDGNIHKKETFL
ncbi:inovirus-type Gp2 protein [Acinetobacter soli]|nr:inovirus-type Gp2 protein [Acinetobacter soli]WEH93381.1 inovirus-type Gp2 protein [Acinetobacter soli]WEH99140.1 inovirus-type Gp2 protein [Acinetobacter soli]WEI01744.1 inovirus-type Gp2 protein [Acinetobacter soli]